jgi:uncharacterized protein YqhQ
MSREKTKCITSIGGQALVEGIMMRGPKKTAVAVRMLDGSISLENMATTSLQQKNKAWRLPFLRGIAGFVDSLTIGYRALSLSVEKSAGDDDTEEESKFDRWIEEKFGDKAMSVVSAAGSVLGVAIAIALFFIFPTWLFNRLQGAVGPSVAGWRSPIEGLLRIVIFIGYIALCAAMPDVRRVFEYHGAEHKTIFCYENDEELTVENVRKHQRFHPRCGTSFLVLMLLIGILIGFLIPFTNPLVRTLAKLLCIPVVVGIGYELIRYCGRNDNTLTHIISAPGLWMQRITTKEPDDTMIEVAIAAMKEVIPENGEDKVAQPDDAA